MTSRKRKIFIHNFELMASIGVYENERKNKQKIIINLDILLTNSSEPKADDLMETQDYSQFRNEIKNIVQSKHFQLLEILVEKIHNNLIKKDFVIGATVKISKPTIFPDAEVAYELSDI